ncbi:MAG: hypothetical protein LQ349_007076 [Xanthoria aureola]|nr:MAG: hypothetical protein LQ349_007076 [Xanthoria aureola]
MDLLYVDNPPGFQILHCLEASTQGGESLFSDALRAVDKVAKLRPEYYATLENFPVTYKYHNNRQTDDLLKKPSIKAVNWSPPFQAPFLVNTGGGTFKGPYPYYSQEQSDDVAAFRTYIEAIRFFKMQLEMDHAILEKKLEPGTAVIFNNRRIVHARRAFENQAGERWLRGAYIDTDVFRSRLRVLEAESH